MMNNVGMYEVPNEDVNANRIPVEEAETRLNPLVDIVIGVVLGIFVAMVVVSAAKVAVGVALLVCIPLCSASVFGARRVTFVFITRRRNIATTGFWNFGGWGWGNNPNVQHIQRNANLQPQQLFTANRGTNLQPQQLYPNIQPQQQGFGNPRQGIHPLQQLFQ